MIGRFKGGRFHDSLTGHIVRAAQRLGIGRYDKPGDWLVKVEARGVRIKFKGLGRVVNVPTAAMFILLVGESGSPEPAWSFFDAMPRECTTCTHGGEILIAMIDTRCPDCDNTRTVQGNAASGASVTVFADQLCAVGDPRGVWLSLWLRGEVDGCTPFDKVLSAVEGAVVELVRT